MGGDSAQTSSRCGRSYPIAWLQLAPWASRLLLAELLGKQNSGKAREARLLGREGSDWAEPPPGQAKAPRLLLPGSGCPPGSELEVFTLSSGKSWDELGLLLSKGLLGGQGRASGPSVSPLYMWVGGRAHNTQVDNITPFCQ